ncbi:MAG: response regulator transcription factor [Actinomycetota bacterium]|nr:response regulator transcription factor [Actinomycetota bacterium]
MGAASARGRLLLVEDDADVRRALRLALSDEGYEVVEARDGREALHALEGVDAVLLDLTLPDGDGVPLCRRIRSAGDTPVIMVTGRSASTEVVAGLEAGADDYVVKPVVAEVLAARVRAVLRRVRPALGPVLHVGELELLVEEGRTRKGGQELHLTRTEFRLLVELAARAGHVVTREQLLRRVWGYDYFGDTRLLDVHVRRLRAKIEDDPDEPRLVLTARGVGYRLARPDKIGS